MPLSESHGHGGGQRPQKRGGATGGKLPDSGKYRGNAGDQWKSYGPYRRDDLQVFLKKERGTKKRILPEKRSRIWNTEKSTGGEMNYTFKSYHPPVILQDHLHLGGKNEKGDSLAVTSLYLERKGRPWIGIMGEFHYFRYIREDWKKELLKMKAGGIELVATYVPWLCHEEEEDVFDFEGQNDLRFFMKLIGELGMEAVVRIGPWVHGELRNGGFPDWLLKKPFPLRNASPEFMREVEIYYRRIARELEGLYFKDGGPILAIQLENELVDDAEYLGKLKKLAINCGMEVPLYTVTGWNSASGAKIPVDEVLPLFGGYCGAPWDQSTEEIPASTHYFFTGIRNDSSIGKDLRQMTDAKNGWQLPYGRYPFADCELGGGLQNTWHRRYLVRGMDIYAMALCGLGEGVNLLGYYMYHGGTNQMGKLSSYQESKATGYPNDYPVLSYDFQAPLSEYGEVREQYRLLNLLHLFLKDYGESFAKMTYVPASVLPGRTDTELLRYALRTDGTGGFVFVNHYQRRTKLKDMEQVVFEAESRDSSGGCESIQMIRFPAMDICGEASFFLPYQMDLGGVRLTWATAQPLCREGDTFFFLEVPEIRPVYCFGKEEFSIKAGREASRIPGKEISVVTLRLSDARFLRRLEGRLYLGEGCDLYMEDGVLRSVEAGEQKAFIWEDGAFQPCQVSSEEAKAISGEMSEGTGHPFNCILTKLTQPAFPLTGPALEELRLSGSAAPVWYRLTVPDPCGFVSLDLPCDIMQLYTNGTLMADDFYHSVPWRLPKKLLFGKECYIVTTTTEQKIYLEK